MDKVDKYLNEEIPQIDVLDKLEVEEMLRETKEFLDDDELCEQAVGLAGWDEGSIKKFSKTIGADPKKHGFFDKCYSRMKGKEGWTDDQAKGFCARIIDKAKGTTEWRGKKK